MTVNNGKRLEIFGDIREFGGRAYNGLHLVFEPNSPEYAIVKSVLEGNGSMPQILECHQILKSRGYI